MESRTKAIYECMFSFVSVTSSHAEYKFLKRQIRWPGIPISFRIFHSFFVIHTVKGFGIVNKEEIGFSGTLALPEVIDISPCNLDSSLHFIQPGILHDVFCIEVK